MILVDTSIWIDHFRQGEPRLVELLETDEVLMHPWVTGELALGNMRQRESTLELLQGLPHAPVIGHGVLQALITNERLFGMGMAWSMRN